jgi:hypothetical protein
MIIHETLARWHQLVRNHDPRGLDDLLADDAVFHSPVVHTPQVGKAATRMYLAAAFQVFFNPSFRYVREIAGVAINGVDMIKCDAHGKITEFKVMIRPLKAINLIHQKMGAMLQAGIQQQQQ